jgi:SAM-dependent methyltransferase
MNQPGLDETPPADHFSSRASEYAAYRPHYPREFFEFLAGVAPARRLAWDCATGNGQAAVPLADWFDRVIATDMSAAQLARATAHPRVEYAVRTAAASGLPDASADLVLVAQALHWLDLDAFYAEVRRVLAPRGVFAVSSYGSASLDTPALTDAFAAFELGTLGAYWPPRRALVGEALRTLDFPFAELPVPAFTLEMPMTLDQLVGYARSWSATANYVVQHDADPTAMLRDVLRPLWGAADARHLVHWPFVVRAGRVSAT